MQWMKTAAAAFIGTGMFVQVQAQSGNTYKEKEAYLNKLFTSKDSADKQLLVARLAKLANGNNERDMMLAARYYYRLGQAPKGDSIAAIELKKFPRGFIARQKEQQTVFEQKTAAGTEAAYKKWIAKFPPQQFKTGEVDEDLPYDYARSAIASRYAEEKNVPKAIEYINKLTVDFWKGNAYGGLSEVFYKNGDLAHAESYAKKAMDNAESYTNGKKGESNAAKFAASGYAGLTSRYANILFEEKKYNEALQYAEAAYKHTQQLSPSINYRYAQILMNLDRHQEAYNKLEEVVKAGKATPEMAETFKTLYVKTKGSDAGYEEYAAQIRKSYLENLNRSLAKSMTNEKAPEFTLTDLDGKSVSLADYRGKVVVLDFWATWCGPCKASFPAMQMAAGKYAGDPNVQFLFIHTWEKSATPADDARNYIKSKQYNFEVLMDTKDPDTKTNKVVSSYKVNGIPAKFVIDPAGNIRFKLTGFDGSNEAAVDELSAMVEMARAGK